MNIITTMILASIINAGQALNNKTEEYEKVYLHFDNTGYFLNEKIWFSAYTTHTNEHQYSNNTLYVEMLAPEGYIVKTQKYKMENGKCNGKIDLPPSLLSGLYEIRAYTKGMATKSNPYYFSQVFPVYDKITNGDYSHRSIFSRNRNTKKIKKGPTALPLAYNYKNDDTEKTLTISYDTAQVRPFGNIIIGIKGKPNSCYSVAVTDHAGKTDTDSYKPTLWMTELKREKYVPLKEATIAPPARAYTEEENALIDLACRKGMNCTIKEPIKSGNKEVIGLTHSCIHSSMEDALAQAKAEGFIEPSNPTETGMKSAALITQLLIHWQYPAHRPFRIISIDGDYCGDECVPKAKAIFDGPNFNYKDYKEIIIRTDSAICNAYGYAEKPIKTFMDKAKFSGFNARTSDHLGKPGIIVCMIPKKEDDVKNTKHNSKYEDIVRFPIPDYRNHTDSNDHRRTLYWNPEVRTDKDGKAEISFYNNSTCTQIAVSAERITENKISAANKQ